MRNTITLLSVFCFFLFACNSKQENIASKYLNPSNLKEQLFTINITKDTILTTQQGLKVTIAANSIEASTPNVTVQIKEALTLDAMLKAGLTTLTSKGILSSDGMFNITTKEASKIVKPIGIAVPTVMANKDMQLYKGKEKDGSIVWDEPEKIEVKKNKETDGETLFKTNCASCHKINEKLTAPELAWIENRWPDRDILRKYIKNAGEFTKPISKTADTTSFTILKKLEYSYEYAQCLLHDYNYMVMNSFEGSLNDTEIDAIINYINQESKNSGLPEDYKSIDSCFKYAQLYGELIYKRDSLVKDNGKFQNLNITQPADQDPFSDMNGDVPKVSTPNFYAEYYQFEINAFGWYNVDDLLMDKFNSKISELSVELNGMTPNKVNTYLIIPSLKVLIPGGKLSNGLTGFYTLDGKLPLPQGFQAYTFALGEAEGKTYFGITNFKTSLSDKLTINLKEIAPEKIATQISNLKLDSLDLTVKKTKNFNSIQSIDAVLQSIKDKVKDCPCFFQIEEDHYK